MSQTSEKGGSRSMVKLGFTLFVITSITAFLLAGVNAMTSGPIAQHQIEARNEAMQAVMPGAAVLDSRTVQSDAYTIYTVQKTDGSVGYCVEVAPSGFGGPIRMIVGIDLVKDSNAESPAITGARVTGVAIVSMSETAGLGTKAKDDRFRSQFTGMVYPYATEEGVSNNAPSNIKVGNDADDIDAISGATITSKAVTSGVNTALNAIRSISAGEGAAQ